MSGYETEELGRIEDALDGMESPTSEDVFQATRPYDERAIATVAATRAVGAGSLADPYTKAVNIEPSETDTNILVVHAPVGQSATLVRVISDDLPDDDLFYIDINGRVAVSHQVVVARSADQLQIYMPTSGGDPFYAQVADGTEAIWVRGDTFTELRPVVIQTSAPADSALSAGQCSVWFDQTNGASKLKIKGKSANGTVVVGEVALT